MYAIIPQQIPQDKRAEVNEKILFAINSGKDLIPAESIYNCYTGVGGCITSGNQTLPAITSMPGPRKSSSWDSSSPLTRYAGRWSMYCRQLPRKWFLICAAAWATSSTTCPTGTTPTVSISMARMSAVARYLYPDAHIEKCDIQQYRPEQRFDIIIGNPPFNLKFDFRLSQEYYMDKAYDRSTGGHPEFVVPSSFMQSEFWEKRRITGINDKFSFVGQCGLAPHAFTSVGVDNFNTKVMVFLRHSRHIGMQPYNADEFVTMEELKERVMQARDMKHRLRF